MREAILEPSYMFKHLVGDMDARYEQIRRDAEHCSCVSYFVFATLLAPFSVLFLLCFQILYLELCSKKNDNTVQRDL